MGKNIMAKNLRQSIRRSLGRYIAIVAIIALGAAIFVGLRTTRSDMVATGQAYMDSQNMFDLRLLSTYGWDKEDVDAVAQIDGITSAEGVISMDVLAVDSVTGAEAVYKLYSIPEQVNKVYLLEGRMPQAPNECLVDGSHATDAILGTTYTVSEQNEEETLESLKERTYTVVGYVSTPLFMDMSRGTTTIGNGSVESYLYIPEESFDVDYYTEIDVTIRGDYAIYTEEYNTAMDAMADAIEPQVLQIANERYQSILQEAEDAYQDGLAEYEDGLAEYEDGKSEADASLEDGRQALLDAEDALEDSAQDLENAQNQLYSAQSEVDANKATLDQSRAELDAAKSDTYGQLDAAEAELEGNLSAVTSGITQINDGIAQIDTALPQLESGISQLESGISQMDLLISAAQTGLDTLNAGISAAELALEQVKADGTVSEDVISQMEAALQELVTRQSEYTAQYETLVQTRDTYSAQLSDLQTQHGELIAQRAALEAQKAELEGSLTAISDGFAQIESGRAEVDSQFADAEAELSDGQTQLDQAQSEINSGWWGIEEGKQAMVDAEAELEDGWSEYREGRDEMEQELSDAQLGLTDAQVALEDARESLEALTEPEVFILGRNTNSGYLSLDSNSNIVAGVSKVFPAFFLLVAALVCITTMTRMVEEERTQIGTLKALGYSNMAIIGKYLAYAGSGAVLGCGLGVIAGSVVFPVILWKAYSIMLNITPNVLLHFDLGLCLLVVGAYTAVTMFVTWYCCRMSLRDVPAELIRPKPPTSGKKIFLEYLPFWNKLKFLNKVMLRNIFRYRQRLLMMLIGIGGCTALLVTGFGIKDSIMDIVSIQFDEVTLFDMEVRFSEGLTAREQEKFLSKVEGAVDQVGFFYQTSMEMDFDDITKDITMIVSDSRIETFFDFHAGGEPLVLPGQGQALLSVGMAEMMGISEGDTVTLRSSDMQTLTVTVSGIFDNHVSNYLIVTPETVEAQWGEVPQSQMAYVTAAQWLDVHYAGAQIAEQEGVMNVSISADMADQVGSMLEVLNLIVVMVVICAGLLAVIVLYNLTNINITERIREIATIKVLGFNSSESAAYVFKENLLLSAMGAVLGLAAGFALLSFVMSQIKVDMVWFEARVLPVSYVWSIVLTMLSACLVDFVLNFKLEKINMAEALKSVE